MWAEFGFIFVKKRALDKARKYAINQPENLVNLTTSNNSRTNFVTRISETAFIPFVNSWKLAEFSRVCSTFVNYFQHDKTDKQIPFRSVSKSS